MIKKVIKRILNILLGVNNNQSKHKNTVYSNSLIDTLVPEYVEIGENFVSAPGSIILGHDASLMLFYQKYRIEKTIIGNNVFLGANSVVLPGIIIEDNVIVGAGAVVTKRLASNGVYAGNPAKYMCSIEEYYLKCEKRNKLYEMTQQMKDAFTKNSKFDQKILGEFRKSVKK